MSNIKDLALSLAGGTVDLGNQVVGFSDLFTNGKTREYLNKLGYNPETTQKIINSHFSDQFKNNQKQFENNGFFDNAKQLVMNPMFAAKKAINIAPTVAGGVSLGAATKMPVLGEAILAAGQSSAEQRKTNTAIPLRNTVKSVMTGLANAAAGKAGSTAAGKLNLQTMEKALFTSTMLEGKMAALKKFAGSLVNEGVAQEGLQNIAGSGIEKLPD